MRIVAALALAAGFAAAPLVTTPLAVAAPPPAGPCDGAGCVPYVDRNIDVSAPCMNSGNRFPYGLDAAGDTHLCTVQGVWTPQPPLEGVRLNRQPCGQSTGVAQTPDGIPLSCIDGGWTADFTPFYF